MKQILEHIADENHVTPEEVLFEMQTAIQIGMNSTDPNVQRRWAEIPKKGEVPTPEEVMAYLLAQITNADHAQKSTQPEYLC